MAEKIIEFICAACGTVIALSVTAGVICAIWFFIMLTIREWRNGL